MTYDRQRFRSQLTSRKAEEVCPICGQDSGWHDAPTHAVIPAAQVDTDTGKTFVNPLVGITVLPLVCKHCGFVRLHEPQVLGIDLQTQ